MMNQRLQGSKKEISPEEFFILFLLVFRQVGAAGIEPASSVCKKAALPLDEAPVLLHLPWFCPQADLQQIHDPVSYGFEPLFQFGGLTLNQ